MKLFHLIFLTTVLYSATIGAPRVAVFPFEPLIDSTYNLWKDQIKVLNYKEALQSFIVAELMKQIDLEPFVVDTVVKEQAEAVTVAILKNADFAVVGTFAELPSAIRVGAQLIDIALGKVPPGYQATAVAPSWDGLSGAAEEVAQQLTSLIRSSSSARSESRVRLILEGDRNSLGYPQSPAARLIVEVNSPSPKISLSNGTELRRCSVKDRSLAAGTQLSQVCYSADLAAGAVEIVIEQRGYYGVKESLSLTGGKVYRLAVELEKMSFQAGPTAK